MGVCFSKKVVSPGIKPVSDLNPSALETFQFYTRLKEDRNYKLLVNKVKWSKVLIKLYLQHEGYVSISSGKNYSFTSNTNSTGLTSDIGYVNLKIALITDYLCKAKTLALTDLLITGPPNNIRWLIWISLVRTKYSNINNEKIYNELILQELKEDIVFDINKDLHRTCPENKYFQTEEGLKTLFNILKAIALYDQRVSYCQGINIIAANILLLSDGNAYETFYFLRYILEILNVRDFYTRGFPKLHKYIYIVKRLIQEKFINVYNKIEYIGLPDEVWLFKWLQTLFSLTVDFQIGVRLWDCIISQHDITFVFKFCLALIKTFESSILESMDMSEFMEAFKIKINKQTRDDEIISLRESLITTALHINIDSFERYSEEYEHQCVNLYEDGVSSSLQRSSQISGVSQYIKNANGEILTSIQREQQTISLKDNFLNTSMNSLHVEEELSASIRKVNVIEYKKNYIPK
jgi:hypothetical protein